LTEPLETRQMVCNVRIMAKTFRPYVAEQELLLPPSLCEWLPENHLAGGPPTSRDPAPT